MSNLRQNGAILVFMDELWQLYDEQGRELPGQGASKDDVFGKGLLHGASHVWIWRKVETGVEVLLQKRAPNKRTWPNLYDISAAGHIDLGEDPLTAAIREAAEEIGMTVPAQDLVLISLQRMHIDAGNGNIENELQWVYLLELSESVDFKIQESEVASVEWKSLEALRTETVQDSEHYVPHGRLYYQTVTEHIETAATS